VYIQIVDHWLLQLQLQQLNASASFKGTSQLTQQQQQGLITAKEMPSGYHYSLPAAHQNAANRHHTMPPQDTVHRCIAETSIEDNNKNFMAWMC
jgi:hypothetical protein